MSMKNTSTRYGWLSISLHWVLGIALIGMYFSGDYMVDLGYYDTLYHTLPGWHKSAGITIAALMLLRVIWNFSHTRPGPADPATPRLSHLSAVLAHLALYGLTACLIISGYLISTAKGAGIDVFGFAELPALLADSAERGDFAGELHELFGTVFIALVALHAAAALYHHFFKKDKTLTRMLGLKGK